MKKNLLEIVQEILNDMDSDIVNDIDDTEESEQVASIVRSTFELMIVNRDWPSHRKLVTLNPSGDSALPTHMTIKDNLKRMVSIRYNKAGINETKKKYQDVKYLDPDAFLRKQNSLNSDASNVDVIVDGTGVELLIRNDIHPQYYTSFDDTVLIFDSYDSSVDSTVQESKVQALGYVLPDWVHTNEAVPDLPADAFPLLIEESKAKASFKLRQVVDQKAEMDAVRQNRWQSRKARKINGGLSYPNYGRRNRMVASDATFRRD